MKKIEDEEFAQLVKEYQSNLYYFALVMLRNETDAQDAVGETVLKAFECRGKLRDPEKFKSWIMRILLNVSYSLLRERQNEILVEELDTSKTDTREDYEVLWEVIMQLETDFRSVVILFYFEDFSTREISKILRIPEGTVRSRLSRARSKLKEHLQIRRQEGLWNI